MEFMYLIMNRNNKEKFKRDNNGIILENVIIEIHKNLEFISKIEQSEKRFKETYEFTNGKFNYYYLEKSLDIIENQSIRQRIFSALDLIKQSNQIIERSDNLFIPVTKEQIEIYNKLNQDAIGTLVTNNKNIKNYLDFIENNLIIEQ